jgi:hypothetical protein
MVFQFQKGGIDSLKTSATCFFFYLCPPLPVEPILSLQIQFFKVFEMKKSTFLLTFILISAYFLNLHAQSNWCGLSAGDAQELSAYHLQVREDMRDFVSERDAVTYVPVRFHLVAKSDGTGRPSERLALQALCLLNTNYADLDIQFYLKEFKYLNSTSASTNPESFGGFNAISNAMAYNAINIFIVDQIADPGVAAYWQGPPGPSGNDWIVVSDNFVTYDNVVTHEVGHFFSLLHTFNGWESSGGWDPAIHGNPVGNNSPDGVPNELVSGANCATAGDYLCDTPADYMFGPDNTCVYSSNAKDPTGALLAPDASNRMNYFYNCTDYHFSNQQKIQINSSLFHSSRNYVRPGITPTLAVVSGTPTLIKPAQSEKIDSYNYVELEWAAVPGANKYLVEVSNSTVGNLRFIVNTNKLVVTTLFENQSYIWRVMAYNEYSTCANYSTQKIFKTGNIFSDTFEIPGFEKWTITPNPVKSGLPILLNVESTGLEANVSLISMTGQIVQNIPNYRFPSGLSTLEIPTDRLPAGIYTVALRTPEGVETQRVAVTN